MKISKNSQNISHLKKKVTLMDLFTFEVISERRTFFVRYRKTNALNKREKFK